MSSNSWGNRAEKYALPGTEACTSRTDAGENPCGSQCQAADHLDASSMHKPAPSLAFEDFSLSRASS